MLLMLLLSVMLNLSWDFQVVAVERIRSPSGRSHGTVSDCSLQPGRKRDETKCLGLRGDEELALAQLKRLSSVLATSGTPQCSQTPHVLCWNARALFAGGGRLEVGLHSGDARLG